MGEMWTVEQRDYAKANLQGYKDAILATKSDTNPDPIKSAVDAFKFAFYDKYKRQLVCDDDTILSVGVSAQFDDTEKDQQWFLDRLIEADEEWVRQKTQEEKEAPPAGGVSINQLIEKANSDTALQSYVGHVASVKDLPSKAPAQVAYRLRSLLTAQERRSFAIPYSNEEKHLDGDKNKLGDNAMAAFAGRWDRYYHKAKNTGEQIQGYWYLDYAKGTTAGQRLVPVIDALDPATAHPDESKAFVEIDGHVIDVRELSTEGDAKSPRRTMFNMMRQRLDAVADLYRKAMQINNQWDDIEERLGNKYDAEGNLTKVGVVAVDWDWLDPQDLSKGISPGKRPIKIFSIRREDLKVKDKDDNEIIKFRAGDIQSGGARAFLVSEFINLSIDEAFVKAGKAGKDMPTFVDVVESRKKKPEPQQSGDGKGQAEDKRDQPATTKLPTAKESPMVYHWMRLQTENEGYRKAFRSDVLANLKREELGELASDMRKLHKYLDDLFGDLPELEKAADEFDLAQRDAENKELAEKLARSKPSA